jgi:hypothetical protein
VICRGRPQGRDDVCHVEEVMLARFPARIIIAAFVEVIHALVPLKLDPAIFANVIGIQRAGEHDRIAMTARSNDRIMLKVSALLPKNNIRQPIGALVFLQPGRLNMTEQIEAQMISRRAALGILGLAAALGAGMTATVLTSSDAEAQTSGTEQRQDKRQDKRQDRTDRRQQRRTSRTERRVARREARSARRETRRRGSTGSGTTTGSGTPRSGTTGSGTTGQVPRQ